MLLKLVTTVRFLIFKYMNPHFELNKEYPHSQQLHSLRVKPVNLSMESEHLL